MAEPQLTGNYFVRRAASVTGQVRAWFPKTSDRMEVRRQALKLRFWPAVHTVEASGRVVDLDWSWIRALPNLKVGELRIDDTIGGHDNLRIIFFVGPESERFPKMCIWILSVFQKKRDEFTRAQLATFRLARLLVLQRYYDA